MTLSSTDFPPILIIKANTCFQIDNFRLEVNNHLGQFADVHYFQVNIHSHEADSNLNDLTLGKPGLLRVGTVDGCLNLERQLRQVIGTNKLVSELLISTIDDWVSINLLEQEPKDDSVNLKQELATDIDQPLESEVSHSQTSSDLDSDLSLTKLEYLEEEFFQPQAVAPEYESPSPKIILLSYLPEPEITLSAWLEQDNPLEISLSLAIQVCQFFQYVYQQGWCFVHINPAFIQVGTPIQFFDLAGIGVVGKKLQYGLTGDYCSSELALGYPVDQQMSTYIIGTLLYQSLHHKLPNIDDNSKLEIKSIPRIYQIINICFASIGEGFTLSQLLSLLRETRQLFSKLKIKWNVASRSTVGLSLSRLENEDSYGIKQDSSNQSEALILAVVADGMGGMAQGEVASKLAVKTVLEEPVSIGLNSVKYGAQWLTNAIQKANDCVVKNVRNGGTTLSLILAIGRELMIAHIGDSRIFLLRNGYICQLSEDHSLVAMLLANGEITYKESQDHPERSVLLRSIGTKRNLSDGYIQDLTRFGSDLSMGLENGDILLICSDGVWDLVSSHELAEIFVNNENLQSLVNETIDKVISRGATDNATILALQCSIEKYYE
ncbi:protein phosphatase 2C domain-containing protein [Nostoc sp. ATCC 53789]|uniref:PP2C family protein-serine/threonine phosphatase n=1 Tax=Nostoc sp. ATCC 53789 TaxID=76335 RepID=UPI000DED0D07|nr:protein phosphatase 2C domain-containing protein [Nostoc sp. ATCC 53789]QHG21138.1 SpoIIE family protein phosphatase [Nostoc sp. ATCC 53789]RCJ19461.1 hypothetical protein A6V25_26825 [Nostoc sp. ATCC 53789]